MSVWFRNVDVLKCTVVPFKKDFFKEIMKGGKGKGWEILSVDRLRFVLGPHPDWKSPKHWIPNERFRDDVLGPPRITILYVALQTKITREACASPHRMAQYVFEAFHKVFETKPAGYSVQIVRGWRKKEEHRRTGRFHHEVELIFGMDL